MVEAVSACPTSELTANEVDVMRPSAYRLLARRKAGPVFVKAHDAYRVLKDYSPLFPADISRRAVYLVRNPLDVAVSFAAHLGKDIDHAIGLMGVDFSFATDTATVPVQLRQFLGNWSDHVCSWLDQEAIPVTPIRYEDLSESTAEWLEAIAISSGLETTRPALIRAVEAASFNRLQSSEIENDFRERSIAQRGLFFRSGRVNGWRDVLNLRQVEMVLRKHERMMARFGYLDKL